MTRAYYRTWGSHVPPREPVDEVEYTASERWDALYLASFDGARLRRFEKIYFERSPLRTVTLPTPRPAGALLYVRPHASGEVTYSESLEIPYAATEGLSRFGRATVSADGARADLYLVTRTTPFVEEYAYRPDGTLSDATVTWAEGDVERYRYDARGGLIAKD